ncbi:hypothetical protein F5Y17DRAFT_432020, partial [Xylariaceae sp. FL0594]
MTSMEAESASTILCTSKQTRFNIGTPNYRELDIEGLSITVTSGTTGKPGLKRGTKGKARSEGTEILDNATLRLKAGQRYALVGRNGSGKSSESRLNPGRVGGWASGRAMKWPRARVMIVYMRGTLGKSYN